MNKLFGWKIYLFLGLSLMGMGSFAVAASAAQSHSLQNHSPQNHSQRMAVKNNMVLAFQERRPPVENSLIRPNARSKPVPDQIYRHDKARDAMKSGRILSLSVIRKQVNQSFPGKIVDVRLIEPNRNSQPYMYMVKVLRKDGKLLVVKINATNAEIVGVKGNG